MILDSLSQSGRYTQLSPHFQKAFSYLHGLSGDLEEGQHEINGTDVFAIVYSHTTAPPENIQYEVHRKYIDIHYIHTGRELMHWAPLAEMREETMAYNETDEAALYRFFPAAAFGVNAGQFAIFFPEDAHIPACLWEEPSHVMKAVIKVRVS